MRALTIFVDMDGTIESLLDVWLERLNKKYNRTVKFEDITCWDMTKAYEGLTREQVMAEVIDDSIWREVKPKEGASDVLQKWISEGHNVYIVTAADYQSIKAKMEDLLFRCFPFLSWKNVIITSNKQLLKGDIMIDDALHNLVGGEYKKILLDAPYNRDAEDEKEGIHRVYSWSEIEILVEKFCQS